jgi:ABC-type transporter Mla subunit MlaD
MARFDKGDIAVGLAVLVALGLAAGAMTWLSAPLRRDTGAGALYTEFPELEGLTVQAPVRIHGFQIGSVDDITPHVSPGGDLLFRVRMSVQWRLADSSQLPLMSGTRALLVPAPVVGLGSPYIALDMAPGRRGRRLAPGALVEGYVETAPVDEVLRLTDSMVGQLTLTLGKTRNVLDSLSIAAGLASRGVRSTDTAIPVLVAGISHDIATLDSAIGSLRAVMGPTAATADSARALLGASRRAVDDLSRSVQGHDANIARIIANLDTTSALLQDFVRQIEAKPVRLITGVTPSAQYQRPIH